MKRRKIIWMLGMAMISFLTTRGQTGTKMTLRECVETAIQNNLNVKQSEILAEQANITLKQARANLLPDLNGNISHSFNTGRSIDPFTNAYVNQNYQSGGSGLNSSIILFNGFRLMNAIKQNALAWEASELEARQTKDNITINVILAYLSVLSNQDQLEQVRNQLELSRRQVQRLSDMNEVGAIPPSDLSDLKGRLAGDQLQIVNAQNNLNAAKLSLAQLMNVPYNPDLEIERLNVEQFDLTYAGDVESITNTAMEQLAMVKAADLRRESAEKGIQVARGNLYPTLGLSGGISTNFSSVATRETYINTVNEPSDAFVDVGGTQYPVIIPSDKYSSEKINYSDQFKNNYSTALRIGLNIPIFNNFQARNQVKLAKLNQKNTELIAQTTKIQLRQLVEQAWFNMTAARDRYTATADQVAAFTESFNAAEVRFNAGASNSVEYLTVRTNLDQAKINLIIARYDYVLRTRILDYYQGKTMW